MRFFNAENNNKNTYNSYFQEKLQITPALLASEFLAHPFVTIWTIQQTIRDKSPTIANAYRKIRASKEGGLYTGFTIHAFGALFGTYAYYDARALSLVYFGDKWTGHLMQGVCSAVAGNILWAPADRMCTLLQASKNSDVHNAFNQSTLSSKIRHIWKAEGVRGFYRGAAPEVLSSIVTSALGSLIQAQLVKCYPVEQQKKFTTQLMATVIAYSAVAVFSSPIDICVARMRMAETDPAHFPDKHFVSTMKTVYRRGRMRGFFLGLPAGIMHSVAENISLPFVESSG